jgi:NAD(P)-dependent dehydrogenase (short-subunit alcohol dehydrogenase family)
LSAQVGRNVLKVTIPTSEDIFMASQTPQSHQLARRDLLRAGALGAVAASSSVLGSGSAFAQSAPAATPAKELAGKNAFITGGARGIGRAVAEELAKSGANVALFDIATPNVPHVQYPLASEADLQAAKAAVEALGVRCLAFKGDVRDRAALTRAMAETVQTFGSLDILVANAGVTQVGTIEEFSDDQISAVLEINLAGIVKTTQVAAPIMKGQKSGRMIFISTALGRMGNELFPVYAASKWAVIGFAKSAALTYGRDGILCNIVAPGLARTKLADNEFLLGRMMPNDPDRSFDRLSALLEPGNPIPFGHLEAIDVARAVLFFAGQATSKVTGEVFDISYGQTARNIA